ncbi:CPSF A subunit region-domain-containing protein [Elsinoe ampelina]|uniref:CPSF A subunit region-domain-containing protein n=1 Tax=Elsinoe ampelina TaxID=302913 RepID=A0A6A6G7P2_9PEZI|nr:CPSF A subunit region-domain-containing protein [Elsinoe ampelina]
MQCYSELLPPTAVTHAISLRFLNRAHTNLVVARTSLLQIFEVKTRPAWDREDEDAAGPKLVLIGEYPLAGVVTSLAKVKAADTKTGGEALLISFKDAKVSLLEWDPESHRISTISIHYYEGGKVPLAPFEPPLIDCDSKLVVDPRSRCAALRFATRHLAILPFRQHDEDIADIEDDFLDERKSNGVTTNGESGPTDQRNTPYAASFVLPLTALDPGLTHPVDIAFLYEYREPTLGVVCGNRHASPVLLDERKDPLSYSVITLDLEQKASTTLLSVKGLPFDIWKVIPLAPPIGGSLLVGQNELVHIDQSGKTNAVGVNEFARACSDFSIADQSYLNMRLENSFIDVLNSDTGDLLIVLDDGRFAILSFRIDGRTVSGLNVHLVNETHGGHVVAPATTAITSLPDQKIFIGSEAGNASLLSWTAQATQQARKRSHAQMLGEDIGLDIDDEDLAEIDDADDDLYGEETLTKSTAQTVSKEIAPSSYMFSSIDSLATLAPIHSVAIGRTSTKRAQAGSPPLDLLMSVGQAQCSRLVKLAKDITAEVSHEDTDSKALNSFTFRTTSDADGTKSYVVLSEASTEESEVTRLFRVNETLDDGPWTEVEDSGFEREGRTLNVCMLAASQRTIHVRDSEVRTYDTDLGLSQIFPVMDANTEDELQVVHSSFCDPYLLLLRNDSSVQLLKADDEGELEEVDAGEVVQSTKWLSACVYHTSGHNPQHLCALLSDTGGLTIFELPDFHEPAYQAPNLAALPPVLTTEDRQRRAATRDTLAEILLANLGDENHRSPYLVVRSSTDEIVLYEPFYHRQGGTAVTPGFCDGLRFRKVPGLHIPRYDEDFESFKAAPMVALKVASLSTIFVSGPSPSFIIKTASTLPRVVDFRGRPVKFLCGFDAPWCSQGFIYGDTNNVLRHGILPLEASFSVSNCVSNALLPLPLGHQIHDIAYHSDRNLYVFLSSTSIDYVSAEEDLAVQESESAILLRPQSRKYHIHLLDPPTSNIISSHSLPQYEIATSLSIAPLEISEITHNQRLLISVGTITNRSDAYGDKGGLYVFDVIPVVPSPSAPETCFALDLISREETRAPITALTGIAGLVGTAQGQKLMWRGLREDGQNLPVAFLDFLTYTTCIKTLGNSRMWLATDAWKGMWFGGYIEEPPRIHVFGKTKPKGGLVTAEFLPFDKGLYLLAVDERCRLQIWAYEPEHPKSLGGVRLVEKSTFELGHLVTGMRLLPSSIPEREGEEEKLHQVLTWATSGQIGLITPLDEARYRRLSALQSQLTNVLEHPAGLNPRAYRNVKSEDGGGRGVVDGDLIKRVGELGAGRRSEVVGRVGDWWEIRGDLEVVGGRGLSYF